MARFGEMDCMRWLNTNGILGRYGELALSRGFPKTQRFTRVKIVFSVATPRCKEINESSNAHNLHATLNAEGTVGMEELGQPCLLIKR